MSFTDQQTKQLRSKLSHKNVRTRQRSGRALSYVEGWFVLAEANRIFGFDGWDRICLKQDLLWERRSGTQTECAYAFRVRVQVYAGERMIVREGSGFGICAADDASVAHETALKTAETDATKRALATFGNRFGLSLYDPEQRGVTRPRAIAQAENGGQGAPSLGLEVDVHLRRDNASPAGLPPVDPPAPETNEINTVSGDAAPIDSASQRHPIEPHTPTLADPIAQLGLLNAAATPDFAGAQASSGDRPSALDPAEGPVQSQSECDAASIRYLQALKRRIMSTQTARDIDHALSDSRVDLEIMKRVSPDLRTKKGVHFADLLTAFAHRRQAVFAANDTPRRASFHLASSPKSLRNIDRRDGAGFANDPDLIVAVDKSRLLIATPKRYRDKDHLRRVMGMPCLVCGRRPSHPHHLKFAQPAGMGLKVSDEFVVPLCALDHNALHRSGDEKAWWAAQSIEPLPIANKLWSESRSQADNRV